MFSGGRGSLVVLRVRLRHGKGRHTCWEKASSAAGGRPVQHDDGDHRRCWLTVCREGRAGSCARRPKCAPVSWARSLAEGKNCSACRTCNARNTLLERGPGGGVHGSFRFEIPCCPAFSRPPSLLRSTASGLRPWEEQPEEAQEPKSPRAKKHPKQDPA